MNKLTEQQIGTYKAVYIEHIFKYALELAGVDTEMAALLFTEALELGTTDNDIAAQFLYATGAAEALEFDIWSNKIELLDKEFGLDSKNILDIGGGPFPVLASKIAELHPSSHVTVLDPNIVPEWYQSQNFEAIRKRMIANKKDGDYTDLNDYDLIYGVHPCEGTIPLIRCASHYKKDYAVWLCDCIHPEGKAKTRDEWAKYVIKLAKGLAPKTHQIEVLSHMIGEVESPVIVCKPKARILVPGKKF